MSTFEQTLVSELHAEADRLAAATDTGAMRAELDRRLDGARSSVVRRRWISAVAAVAAAAVVVAVAVVATQRISAQVPPAQGTGWTGEDLYTRPQLQLPDWAADVEPVVAAPRLTRWSQGDCGQDPCEAGKDRVLGVYLPLTGWDAAAGQPTEALTWVGAAEYFSELTQAPGVVPVEGQAFTQQATKSAGVANVAVITTKQDIPGALGCSQLDSTLADCQSLVRGTRTVIALVNAGDAPLVVWSSALASTDAAAQDAEMAQVLASLGLTGLPVSCTDSVALPEAKANCANDLFARIQRDATALADGEQANQSHFDAAARPYVEDLSRPGVGYLSDYERGPFDGDNATSTKPTTVTLTVGGEKTTSNVCFAGPQVIITSGPCAAS